MSGKRLSKRQLRELQDLEALSKPRHDERDIDLRGDEDGKSPLGENLDNDAPQGERGLFAQMGQIDQAEEVSLSESGAEEGGDDAEDDGGQSSEIKKPSQKKKKQNKKKKRKPAAALEEEMVGTSSTNGTNAPQQAATSKTKDSTNAKHGKALKDVSAMSMDEFSALLDSQAALDETNGMNVEPGRSQVKLSGPLPSLRAHLALSVPFLDPTVELKRQFGAAAIKAYESEANQSRGGGAANAARARAIAWNTNFKVKSILVQPQDTWPPIAKTFTGMTMETIEDDAKTKIGGWVHSKAYRKAQLQFLKAVQSYEPNHLISLLRLYPWHIDTLLQLSEVSRHQGDLGAASDWNSRALFAYERTSTTVFSSSLTSSAGPPLLSFSRIENRGFWIASHRHVNFLGRRGTWRTALEWVKLMIGVDPTYDHHGMILWLDFLSIKSRQYKWFLECLSKLESAYSAEIESRGDLIVNAKTPFDADKELIGEAKSSRGALDWCLGCAFARALALRAIEKEEGDKSGTKSTAALRIAIARHPHLLPPLFDKIGLTLPKEMKSSHLFDFDVAGSSSNTIPQILAHIYISRSESLWRDADTSAWLLATLQEVYPILESRRGDICPPVADMQSRMGIYRHILVSDLPDALRQTLIGLIPRQFTSDSTKLNAYDPLPPSGESVTYYDDDYFEAVTRERSQRRRDQGVTDTGIMIQFMNAIRGVQGLEAWENVMEDMDDEAREDVMAQMLQLTAEAGDRGEMPGAFDGAVERQDRDANQAEAGSGAFAALRGVLGRLWGEERTEAALQQQRNDTDEDGDDFEPQN